MFIVDFFIRNDGGCPTAKFLDSLDIKMRAKCLRLLALLEHNGNDLKEPYSKAIGNGLYELRVKQGNNITRFLYFYSTEHRIIVTNGFVKKSQKIPKREITLANKYREEYLMRKEKCDE